jgi:basic membrane protein A
MPASLLLRSIWYRRCGSGERTISVEVVKQVRAGSWKSSDDWWPISTGIAALSPYGPAVPDAVKALVAQRQQEINAARVDVFWGPIKDQSGRVRIAEGEKAADTVLLSMDWCVEGVVGTVPQ